MASVVIACLAAYGLAIDDLAGGDGLSNPGGLVLSLFFFISIRCGSAAGVTFLSVGFDPVRLTVF